MTFSNILAAASAVVSKALYDAETLLYEDRTRWINRSSREERIASYRNHHSIPDNIPDDTLLQAISEDWDLS